MAAFLESLKDLSAWEGYREFMKERMKQLPDGANAFYVSKEKVEFSVDGKPWKGYAVLLGPKGELAAKKMRKDGLQFREGSCRLAGKELAVDGLDKNFLRFAALTMKRLRLGYSIAGVDEEAQEPAPADDGAGRATAELEARSQELLDELKSAAALREPANDAVLKQAAGKAKQAQQSLAKRDAARAGELLDELEGLLSEIVEGPETAADADPDLAGLADWKAYREFLKANLKRLPAEGGPGFVSRKKVQFSIEGKPYTGFAVLIGKKARVNVQTLKKEGTLFEEGTVTRKGKVLLFAGIKPELLTGAAKTFLKLRLGHKIAVPGAVVGDADVLGGPIPPPAPPKPPPPALSAKLKKMVGELGPILHKLREAADALKKAGEGDQPYRKEFEAMVKELGEITVSHEPEKVKEERLARMKRRAVERTLDAKVSILDPNDPKTGEIVVKQLKARYGVSLKLYEELHAGTDAKSKRQKFKRRGRDAKAESYALKELYLTMAKVPNFPKEKLTKLELSLRPSTANSEGGVYYEDSKKAAINCRRPVDSFDASLDLDDATAFPGRPAADKQSVNKGVRTSYFSWATLHEVAHAVDAKYKFMDSREGNAKYGGWKVYGYKPEPIAPIVASHFGTGLGADDLKALEAYALALITRKKPKAERSPAEKSKRAAVDAWYQAANEDAGPWWSGGKTTAATIGTTVYQESYTDGGPWWTSYPSNARSTGVTGYQFRAPGEWFAELYAAYYSQKLKPSHSIVPDLQALETKK